MKANIKKWGNSYALRIPKLIIEDAQLTADSEVEISIMEGKIIITPSPIKNITLNSLIEKITEENIHHEIDTGPAIGKEVE